VPNTPTVVGVGGGGGSSTTQPKDPGSSSATPSGCLRVSLSRHTVPVNRRTVVVATVRRASTRVAGVRVVVRGEGVSVGATTNRKGSAKIALRTRRRGRLTVRVRGQRASCPAPTVRAL
jgi:hypothetical protein